MMNPLLVKLRMYMLITTTILGYPFFLFFTHSRKKKDVDIRKYRILIIPQLPQIGDLICATPMFRAIKEKYPGTFLAVLVSRKNVEVVQHHPDLDEIIIYEEREYTDFFGSFRLFRKIHSYKFDWSINVAASVMGTLISVYASIPNRVKIIRSSRTISEILTDWINTHPIKYIVGENIPRLYLKTLKFFDIDVPSIFHKKIYVLKDAKQKAKKFLEDNGLTSGDLIVGISVSAGNKIKEWPSLKWTSFIRELIDKHDAKIIFIGKLDDKEKVNEINRQVDNQCISAVGEFSLEEVSALIKNFTLFVASDSGTIHIADAVDTPLIDIVGPVDPDEQTPEGESSIIVKPPKYIQPTIFALRPAGSIEESRKATESITTEKVLDAFKKLYASI